MSELERRAREWLTEEIRPDYAAALQLALDERRESELFLAFGEPLNFGTAGLRGTVGYGSARMNEVVVAKASYGLVEAIQRRNLGSRPVVIGYDGRAESKLFARLCASIVAGFSLPVFLIDDPTPTPVIVYAGRQHSAAAIVAVTPSHNPRGDAGFKVYDDEGIQIVSPWDSEIAASMKASPNVRTLPNHFERVGFIGGEVYQAYAKHLGKVVGSVPRRNSFSTSRVAYTPLHGVGLRGAKLVAQLCGASLEVVREQSEVDGSFPTTPFPNPEERGTLDLLHRDMERNGISLGLANDPDADRLAVSVAFERSASVPVETNRGNSVRRLSGDELGLLLASLALEARRYEKPALANSIVSSPSLAALAASRGASHEYTLTGFKWLCRAALAHPQFVFAYEEALGYCYLPDGDKSLLDKDGLSAMALLLSALNSRDGGTEGQWVLERLRSLAREVGLWGSFARSFKVSGDDALAQLGEKMRLLRRGSVPAFGGVPAQERKDFLVGAGERSVFLGKQDLLVYEMSDGGRICVRPSGTEPKLKVYLHLVQKLDEADDYSSAKSSLDSRGEAVLDEFAAYLASV